MSLTSEKLTDDLKEPKTVSGSNEGLNYAETE
jgi:hypothetical protein